MYRFIKKFYSSSSSYCIPNNKILDNSPNGTNDPNNPNKIIIIGVIFYLYNKFR